MNPNAGQLRRMEGGKLLLRRAEDELRKEVISIPPCLSEEHGLLRFGLIGAKDAKDNTGRWTTCALELALSRPEFGTKCILFANDKIITLFKHRADRCAQ
ncbi:uncharacterized protein PADG_11360 [Paracoccidioides brasiliensis Pb18]|uniref:Uncharacterized protein n=1 Tax=Paracoccidioides brasiliensis (strain Pb18) TaxID=502780 RepID=A0A0A0HVA6_PARBD|nr:uncharacterized protein PADG_11360 [Paracoccidioides brasiliensis Pb18]KGM92532.1 hypothetical protein PADG_11360 [Paracoccidioides brasiliensis Pb18]